MIACVCPTSPYVVVRADAPVQGKVGIVSGGGSGHEPMHGGFVGPGMLDAACPGEVFTSPTPDQMLEATKAVDGGAGVLHIVKNYTGDVLNFEMAADLAEGEGIEVEAVVINDDVAVQDSLYTAGRRGVGATVLAEKICGAAAEAGPLARRGRRAVPAGQRERPQHGHGADRRARRPAAGEPSFELADDEMEIGIGIHGEPGRDREKLGPAARDRRAAGDARSSRTCPYESGDSVLAFVNGMGGTPLIELYVVYRELTRFLDGRGITIARNLIGNYITSLEMAGCSITLLKLDDELTALWDAPVDTPALRWGLSADGRRRRTSGDGRGCADFAAAVAEHKDRADARSTPRSATATTAPTWTAACAGGRREARRHRRRRHRRAAQDRRHDARSRASAERPARCTARSSCRWARRPPAGASSTSRAGPRRCAAGVAGRRRRAARPSRATRRCSTRCCPRVEALRAAAGGGRGARRRAARSADAARDGHGGDDPARGAQGPRQLPRPAQRRPPGPRARRRRTCSSHRRGALPGRPPEPAPTHSSSSSTQSSVRCTALRHLR